jgi:hypothetical protein
MFKVLLPDQGPIQAEPLGRGRPPESTELALLVGIMGLDLPPASGGAWFENYRDNQHWRSRHARIRSGARHVAIDIDMKSDTRSPAAQLCRTVEIEALPDAIAETCRIEAIIDHEDGWLIAAVIDRTQRGPLTASATTAVTLERLEPGMASRR